MSAGPSKVRRSTKLGTLAILGKKETSNGGGGTGNGAFSYATWIVGYRPGPTATFIGSST